MASRSVVTLTTAPAGTGKSYRRCAHFIVTELLPDTELKHLSNFPIKFEEWENSTGTRCLGLCAVAEKRGAATPEEVRERIELIPEEELERWLDGSSGPWDTFREKDLSGYHLAIDEIHNFCGKNTSREIKSKWQAWLGELRHRGARIEFISQHPMKMAKEIREEAEVLLELHAGETEFDPWFHISMGDWYQLIAKITGKYRPVVYEVKSTQVRSHWKKEGGVKFRFEPDLFEVYDSFSAPVQGGGKGALAKEPWESKTWLQFGVWFLLRNLWPLSSRVGIVCLMLWLSLFGGAKTSMTFAMEWMKSYVHGEKEVVPGMETGKREVKATGEGAVERLQQQYPGSRVFVGNQSQESRAVETGGRRANVGDIPRVVGASAVEPVKEEQITEEQIEAELSGWAVVAVTSEGVWFQNGEMFLIGEEIPYGPYEGKTVVGVDLLRRRADIGGGVVRLRSISASGLREYALKVIRSRRKSDVQ